MGNIDWGKIHRFQDKPGWCGPASIQMVLLAGGIKQTQSQIADAVDKDWWGTTQDITVAYLSKFFGEVNFKINASISDIKSHLEKGHVVIAVWWDDLGGGEADGHYSLVADVDLGANRITLADPSRDRKGIWEIDAEEFESRWYDYLDTNKKIKVERWVLWVDPKSKLV